MSKLDITSTAVEKGIDLVKGFVEKLVGASIEETGLMWADNIKLIRFKNQLKILTKAQKIVAENGINVKQISLKTLVPLLEYSSLEDDGTLQDKWTNLIVNFIDADEKYESTIFPFLLNQLTSNEVIIIDIISSNEKVYDSVGFLSGTEKSNLVRLGLIDLQYNQTRVENSGVAYNKFKISELGKEFFRCCSPRK